MRPLARLALAASCLALIAPAALIAQEPPAATAAPAAGPTAAEAIPPEVRVAVTRMATALHALTSFQVVTDYTSEDVLETGQKLQSSSVMTIESRRPDRLFIDVVSEQRTRQYYYDGKTLTVYGPKAGFYAAVDAPPTTYLMLKMAAKKYGVSTPLADLIEWGGHAVRTDKIKSAMYVGPDRIAGVTCDHYAFRQESSDWQLWISKADPALPCKMVITNTTDPAQPQSVSVFKWDTGAQFADSNFQFVPPGEAKRIMLGQVSTPPAGAPK